MPENLKISLNASFGSEYQKQLVTHALRIALLQLKDKWEEVDEKTKIEIEYAYPQTGKNR